MQVLNGIAVGVAYAAAISIERLGGIWEDSFLFISISIFLVLFRLLIRIRGRSWITSSEWIFVPIYLLLIPSLWWWVKEGIHAFAILFGVCLCSWLLYIQGLMSDEDLKQ